LSAHGVAGALDVITRARRPQPALTQQYVDHVLIGCEPAGSGRESAAIRS